MKNLTKMIAVIAAASSMHFAQAEEREYAPVANNNAKITDISIVNGQVEVRAPGAEMQGIAMPYAYVSTNTTKFAQNAFAKAGMDKMGQYVHIGNGQIYMTEKDNPDNAYMIQIKKAPAALNGVPQEITQVSSSEDETLTAKRSEMEELQAAHPETLFKIFGGEIYKAVAQPNDDSWAVLKYDGKDATGTNEVWNTSSWVPMGGNEIKDFVVVTNGDADTTYALGSDGKAYSNARRFSTQPADSIALAGDKETVILTYNGQDKLFNGANGKAKEDKVETSLTQDQIAELKEKAQTQASGEIVATAVAGDILYYATAKKLGYVNIHE